MHFSAMHMKIYTSGNDLLFHSAMTVLLLGKCCSHSVSFIVQNRWKSEDPNSALFYGWAKTVQQNSLLTAMHHGLIKIVFFADLTLEFESSAESALRCSGQCWRFVSVSENLEGSLLSCPFQKVVHITLLAEHCVLIFFFNEEFIRRCSMDCCFDCV